METLELSALRLAAGLQVPEELPSIAADALVRGFDSPMLRVAAGASTRDPDEARDAFTAALAELGIELPGLEEALWRLVRYTAEQILSGEVSPYDGAAWIWWKAEIRMQAEGDLRIFAGLASEWEELPNQRAEIDRAIVEEARILLGRSTPRRWLKLMAKNGQSPLWEYDTHTHGDRPVTDLPLPVGLTKDLHEWAAEFDATFTEDDPSRSGFESQRHAVEFVERGRRLVGRLQDSLGPSWHVEYWPAATQPPGLRLKL